MRIDPVTFVLPGDVDDVALASGGNTYDRRMCEVLGPRLRAVTLPGEWPVPAAGASSALDGALAAVPDGSPVLLDGLVACGVPHVVVPHARRLRLAVLLHLPLGDETGLPADRAAALDSRERETVHAVAAVIATSAWAGRRIAEHHGLRMRRVHVVPPGTDPAPPAAGSDGTRLLCLGSITPRKGQDVLAEALAGIVDLPWTCACVGSVHRDPGYVERLRGLITRHGLTGRMSLAGALAEEELRAAWHETDLLVLASRGETFGMVVTEALARGIPVLSTDAGALPDTLGRTRDVGVPGMLVPPDDAPALREALRRYLTRPTLRDRLRAAARERRRGLEDWDAAAGRLAGVLAQLRGGPSWAA